VAKDTRIGDPQRKYVASLKDDEELSQPLCRAVTVRPAGLRAVPLCNPEEWGSKNKAQDVMPPAGVKIEGNENPC